MGNETYYNCLYTNSLANEPVIIPVMFIVVATVLVTC